MPVPTTICEHLEAFAAALGALGQCEAVEQETYETYATGGVFLPVDHRERLRKDIADARSTVQACGGLLVDQLVQDGIGSQSLRMFLRRPFVLGTMSPISENEWLTAGDEWRAVQASIEEAVDVQLASRPVRKLGGWTQGELITEISEAGGPKIVPATFRKLRRKAGLPESDRGAMGANRRYSFGDARLLAKAGDNGALREGRAIAKALRSVLKASGVNGN